MIHKLQGKYPLMIAESGDPTPLVCVPDAISAAERSAHFDLAKDLFRHRAQARKDLPAGYAFQFQQGDFEALACFIANERKCCPAIRFELEVGAGRDPIWLRMTGPQGAREFLSAELPID